MEIECFGRLLRSVFIEVRVYIYILRLERKINCLGNFICKCLVNGVRFNNLKNDFTNCGFLLLPDGYIE